jgi:Ca-activated chloride channel family protein
MRIREACLFIKGKETQVPLQNVTLEAEVLDIACSMTITQEYRNTEKKAVEAVYCFPVEEGAAVYDFEIKTGGRTLRGVVEERDKAFETYDRAIDEGDASFLLDQESGDILFISVGNIKPEQDVTVCIRYVKQLSIVDGIVRLQIPTTVSPRYVPAGTDPLKADRITPDYDLEVPYRFRISVKLRTAFAEEVTSPSHKIKTRREGDYIIVCLEEETVELDRDFVLEITAGSSDKPVCIRSTHENGDTACIFRFIPDFNDPPGEEIRKSEIIFVLDCSGSMQGTSITEAKEALELSLRALSEKEYFNIFRFGSGYESFSPQSMDYSSKSLDQALQFLRGIDADMGGTEIYSPLEHICSLPVRRGYRRDVVLITDGEVANPDEVIQLVNSSVEKNPSLRFFTFGIGYGASHYLVKGIARAGRGKCEMVMPGEKIQPKVLRQLSRMGQPCMTDISLSFESADSDNRETLPPLYEGDSYTLHNKLNNVKKSAMVILSGKYLGKGQSWTTGIVDAGNDNTIPVLWAMSRIERLKTRGVGGSNQKDRQQKRIRNEITRLGLQYNLLTDYTSFVSVEKRKGDKKELGRPEYRRIPVMMTRDWHGISSLVLSPSRMFQRFGSAGRVSRNGHVRLFCTTPQRLSFPEQMLMYKKKRSLSDVKGGSKTDFKSLKKQLADQQKQSLDRQLGEQELKRDSSSAHTTEADTHWCLALLKTQQADGSFTGLKIISRHLGIPLDKLRDFFAGMDGVSSKIREKVFVTWVAVNFLCADPDASAFAEKAIQKAILWLIRQNAMIPAVYGVRIDDAFKKIFGVALV